LTIVLLIANAIEKNEDCRFVNKMRKKKERREEKFLYLNFWEENTG